jgi:hydroxymethylbilane synthase
MSNQVIRIGTRDSQLAVWQATTVKNLLLNCGIDSELVFIKSEGDEDLITPLYQMGVQGIFTKSLDVAILNNRIDIAVHSMKDVPTQLATGIVQAAVLDRASYKDVLVFKNNTDFLFDKNVDAIIATSSIRRKAQWLYHYTNHTIENLRGNVNTRLKKLDDSNWNGAIFAKAGLERIELLPPNHVDLDWMLPAPAQGAVVVVCRENDHHLQSALLQLNHLPTAICTKAERDFLKTLQGGCTTPISALAVIENDELILKGNVFSVDGKNKFEIELKKNISASDTIGIDAANEILKTGGAEIIETIRDAKK